MYDRQLELMQENIEIFSRIRDKAIEKGDLDKEYLAEGQLANYRWMVIDLELKKEAQERAEEEAKKNAEKMLNA